MSVQIINQRIILYFILIKTRGEVKYRWLLKSSFFFQIRLFHSLSSHVKYEERILYTSMTLTQSESVIIQQSRVTIKLKSSLTPLIRQSADYTHSIRLPNNLSIIFHNEIVIMSNNNT